METSAQGLTILEIVMKNNRTIELFQLRPEGANVSVAGDTGSGKTTAISALWDILSKCPDSITHGKKKNEIRVKLSDGSKVINAVRRTTPTASKVIIFDNEGDAISITDFKKMISDLSVNPHKILDMKPTEQLATLAKAADMGDVDLGKMDEEIAEAETERLELSRVLEMIAPGEEPEKVERVDVAALVEEKDAADAVNLDIYQKEQLLDGLVDAAARNDSDIVDAREVLADLEARLEAIRKKDEELIAALKDLEEIPTEGIKKQIDDAQETNSKADAHLRWFEKAAEHEVQANNHRAAADKVKELRAAKKETLDGAKWPLDGLSIEDGEIIYNGYYLANLGTSEQLLVCSALALSDILAHPIRVVRLDGAESMSKDDFDKLTSLFNGHGVQVLSTRVSRGDVEPNEIEIIEGKYTEEAGE